MAISFKYVGDLNGGSHPVLVKVPMNNVKMSVGDSVVMAISAQAGYLGLSIAAKSIFGVIQGFVKPNGEPITPQNLPASATTTSTGPVCMDLTISADGDAHALVSVSPTAVYAVPVSTAPTAGTQYVGGGGDLDAITSGAQTLEVVSAGTWSGKTLLVVPFGTTTGIDPKDSTRLRVIIKENELFGIIQT
jgi:hypothetical protein